MLDIGCGWGGLIIHAAQHYGVRAHGISQAPNQVGKALARAKSLGLESRVTAESPTSVACQAPTTNLVGRHVRAFVSARACSIFYAHQQPSYGRWHRSAAFHGVHDHKTDPDPFVQTYIIRARQPQLSLALKGLEREKLAVLDVENIARHYLPTAQSWHDRFEVNKSQLDPAKYTRGSSACSIPDGDLHRRLHRARQRRLPGALHQELPQEPSVAPSIGRAGRACGAWGAKPI